MTFHSLFHHDHHHVPSCTIQYILFNRENLTMTPSIPYLRTPEERFADLRDFPYKPHYLQYGDLRVAYIDERNDSSSQEPEVFLCLHGQPTWSYLYRKMIPEFLSYTTSPKVPARRVICPDLLGFGRSDKPKRDEDYTFHLHRDMLLHFIRTLNLRNVTLVVQDWGGLLGLTLPMEDSSRYKRLIVMNTTIAAGMKPTKGFEAWKAYANRTPDMDVGRLISRGTPTVKSDEIEAYNAPYPSVEYKGGVRTFPSLVMVDPGMEGVEESKRAVQFFRDTAQFKTEDIIMAVGMQDPVLGPPVMKALSKTWRDGCLWTEIEDAGHFVQEWGDIVARRAVEAFENNGKAKDVSKVGTAKASL